MKTLLIVLSPSRSVIVQPKEATGKVVSGIRIVLSFLSTRNLITGAEFLSGRSNVAGSESIAPQSINGSLLSHLPLLLRSVKGSGPKLILPETN